MPSAPNIALLSATPFRTTLAANTATGLPPIDVTPNQDQLLRLLARIQDARSIVGVRATRRS